LSKLNQKYHIAMLTVALPKIPGSNIARATLKASGNADNEFTPETPIANSTANSDPKSIQARTEHTKYAIRAVLEIIQLLVMGR
jgi:hypothetical protein